MFFGAKSIFQKKGANSIEDLFLESTLAAQKMVKSFFWNIHFFARNWTKFIRRFLGEKCHLVIFFSNLVNF